MRFLSLAALALLTLTSLALDLPTGGTDIRQGRGLQASASQGVGIAEPLPTGNRITISAATPSKPFGAQFTAPITDAIAKNEPVLAIIKARMIHSATTEAVNLCAQRLELLREICQRLLLASAARRIAP